MTVSVIIVSYNTRELLFKCLQSIFHAHASPELELIIVDNASTDNSVAFIKDSFPQVKFILNQTNLGFGVANNQGAQIATGDYLFFLNSDTQLLGEALSDLLKLTEKHHAVISSCQLLNYDRSIQPQGGALPHLVNLTAWMTFLDDLPLIKRIFPAYQRRYLPFFQKDTHVGWLAGTALMVKKTLFNQLGGFNPDIFMYGEDVDFCFRAKKIGVSPIYFHTPQILHLGQGSGNNAQAILGEFKFIKYFYEKYKPKWQLSLVGLIIQLGCLLRVLVFGMIGQYEQKTLYQQVRRLV